RGRDPYDPRYERDLIAHRERQPAISDAGQRVLLPLGDLVPDERRCPGAILREGRVRDQIGQFGRTTERDGSARHGSKAYDDDRPARVEEPRGKRLLAGVVEQNEPEG